MKEKPKSISIEDALKKVEKLQMPSIIPKNGILVEDTNGEYVFIYADSISHISSAKAHDIENSFTIVYMKNGNTVWIDETIRSLLLKLL